MGVETEPAKYTYTCDVCNRQHVSLSHISRPQHWAWLIVERGLEDYQGQEVADGSMRKLLCHSCMPKIAKMVTAAAEKLKAELALIKAK